MKKILVMLALAVTAAALVACGGGGDDDSSTTLTLTADPSGAPKFDKSSLTADAGKITIELNNPTKTPQNVAIKDQAGKVYGITNGGKYVTNGTASVTVDLDAGSYIYYSTQPGYRDKGMQGVLTVN
jgi:ABC-type glycerol-3-phosphate transport system substrate-binding protein